MQPPNDARLITEDLIDRAAAICRQHWGLGMGPIPDLTAELEANGIVTSQIHVGVDNLDAFSHWSASDRTPYVIHGIDKGSAARCRFDAAHELAHLVLHYRIGQLQLNKKQDYKLIEEQA